MIDAGRCLTALEATWPPAGVRHAGPWRLRDGAGGGKRVSSAVADGPVAPEDVAAAGGLVMLRPQDAAVARMLDAAGWRTVDPTVLMAGDAARIAAPDEAVYDADAPLAAQTDLWAAGGIGPARLAVMDRVTGPKSYLLGRDGDRVAAAGFVACDGGIAMLHALEVAPEARRRGLGARMTRAAAHWATGQGATILALAVTEANAPARSLYAALGLVEVGRYAYRQAP